MNWILLIVALYGDSYGVSVAVTQVEMPSKQACVAAMVALNVKPKHHLASLEPRCIER